MVMEGLQAVWETINGADKLTKRQMKQMFDAADGSGNNGVNGAVQAESQPWQIT